MVESCNVRAQGFLKSMGGPGIQIVPCFIVIELGMDKLNYASFGTESCSTEGKLFDREIRAQKRD